MVIMEAFVWKTLCHSTGCMFTAIIIAGFQPRDKTAMLVDKTIFSRLFLNK